MSATTTEDLRREQEEAAWGLVQPKSERSGGSGGSPQVRLERGQREEREGRCPPGAKPKFVKITSGVHVQTRGPILLVKFDAGAEAERHGQRPWFICELPGDMRLSWYEGRDEVFKWISRSERLGYSSRSIGDAKGQARSLIWVAEGRLGS